MLAVWDKLSPFQCRATAFRLLWRFQAFLPDTVAPILVVFWYYCFFLCNFLLTMLWTWLPDSPNGLIFLLFFLIFRFFQCSIFSEIFDFFRAFSNPPPFLWFFICSVLINECPFLASQYHLNSHQTHLLSWCLFLLRLYNSSLFSPSFSLLILFSFSLLFPLLFFSTLDSPANLLPKLFSSPSCTPYNPLPSLAHPDRMHICQVFASFFRGSAQSRNRELKRWSYLCANRKAYLNKED